MTRPTPDHPMPSVLGVSPVLAAPTPAVTVGRCLRWCPIASYGDDLAVEDGEVVGVRCPACSEGERRHLDAPAAS